MQLQGDVWTVSVHILARRRWIRGWFGLRDERLLSFMIVWSQQEGELKAVREEQETGVT
jgi:hypothetical protein